MSTNKAVEIIGEKDNGREGPIQMTLEQLRDFVDNMIRARLDEHAKAEAERMDKRFDELKALLASAFPGGDPDEHRRYHAEAIEFMRERRELWRSIREKSITALVWAAIVAVGSAVWQFIKAKLGAP